MRRTSAFVAVILWLLAVSTSDAQCNRGSRGLGRTATSSLVPLTTSTGFSSPMAALNPIGSSPNAAFLAAYYRSQWARQQYLLAQQQAFRQAQNQRRGNSASPLSSAALTDEERTTDVRRERLKRENAERALEQAGRAETTGDLSKARRRYRKVIRILGSTDALGKRAASALERLAQRKRNSRITDTIQASLTN